MPVPSAITDLSTTAGSNSPAGTDPIGTDADNYIRAHAAFIAQLRDGSKNLEAGTATAPSLAFTGDTNTGIYSSAADKIDITAGGTRVVTVSPTYFGVLASAGNAAAIEISGNGNAITSGVSINQNASDQLIIYNRKNASIILGTNNTTQWTIDSTGRLLNTSNAQPSFRAHATTDLTALSAGATVVFGTEDHDQGSGYNNSTGVFTAPVAGVYHFSVSLLYFNQSGFEVSGDGCYLKHNSTAVAYGLISVPHNYSIASNISLTLRLAANDTMAVCVLGATSVNFFPQGSTSGGVVFSGHLLG